MEFASAQESESAPPRTLPAHVPGAALRTLPGTIGNAAFARLAAERRGGSARPRGLASLPGERPSAAVAQRGNALLRAAVAARVDARAALPASRPAARTLQRDIVPVPPCQVPNSWTDTGPNNPSPTCEAYDCNLQLSARGSTNWRFYYSVVDVPKVLGERCGCDAVRTGFDLYFRAQVPRSRRELNFSDNGNCISEQLAKSKAHDKLEAGIVAKWQARQNTYIPMALGGAREAEIDLIDAVDKSFITPVDSTKPLSSRRADSISYNENNLAGGLLFGGGSATGRTTDDSEFGPDTRDVSGTIKLRRSDNGSDPNSMSVGQTITFNYALHDALDFCPGNSLQKSDWSVDRLEYNEMVTVLSRLEATGMVRDVGYTVKYHREAGLFADIPLGAGAGTQP